MNPSTLSIRGIYRDVLHKPRQGVVHDSGWVSNTIVSRFRVLLASFVKNQLPIHGLRHLAVGQGDPAWDSDGIPAPSDASTALVQPYEDPIVAEDLEVEYLDIADEVQEDPSSRIQITAQLAPGYPPPTGGLDTYPLREFGLFGELAGVPYMLNSIRHPVIHKNSAATLIRIVRLYF